MMPKILLLLLIMICDFFALPCIVLPRARRKMALQKGFKRLEV